MLLLLALLGCRCPTFDEMRVEGKDETATEDRLEQVEVGLAWFARWTGDEGVCVPEIHVKEDLWERRAYREAHLEAIGQYRGPRDPIKLDADADRSLLTGTLHELCHANDHLEGHSTAMSFPDAEYADVIPEDLAAGEAFAEVCELGPASTTLDTTLSALCGTEPFYADHDRYLSEVVYPDYPYPDIRAELTPISLFTRPWTGLGREARVLDVIAAGEEVAMLVADRAADGETEDLSVRFFDAALEPTGREIPLLEATRGPRARFVPADEGLYVRLEVYEGDDVWSATLVELGDDGVTELPLTELAPVHEEAISGGVLYAAQYYGFLAWDLDGTPVDLADRLLALGWSTYTREMWPEADGFGFYADEGLGRYDAAEGAWTVEGAHPTTDARVALGDGRAVVRAPWDGARMLLYEDGAYSFLGDPCEPALASGWAYSPVVGVGGRLWSIGEVGARGGLSAAGWARYVQEIVLE